MFQVLLPVDSDEQHAEKAAEIIESLPIDNNQMGVTILNVEKEVDVTGDGGSISSEEWFDKTDLPTSAETVKDHLSNQDVPVEMTREHGDPGTTIVEVADEIEADRIVMVSQKRTPTGKALFGSTTQTVLLNSTTPVTVVME